MSKNEPISQFLVSNFRRAIDPAVQAADIRFPFWINLSKFGTPVST